MNVVNLILNYMCNAVPVVLLCLIRLVDLYPLLILEDQEGRYHLERNILKQKILVPM